MPAGRITSADMVYLLSMMGDIFVESISPDAVNDQDGEVLKYQAYDFDTSMLTYVNTMISLGFDIRNEDGTKKVEHYYAFQTSNKTIIKTMIGDINLVISGAVEDDPDDGTINHELSFSEYQKIDVDTQDVFGRTMLHFAVSSDHDHVVGYLLKLGANPNISDSAGRTPFHDDYLSKPMNKEQERFNQEQMSAALRSHIATEVEKEVTEPMKTSRRPGV